MIYGIFVECEHLVDTRLQISCAQSSKYILELSEAEMIHVNCQKHFVGSAMFAS